MNEITGRDFGRLEGKVDQIGLTMTDVDKRLRNLELAKENSAGRLSVITASVSVIVSGVVAWAARHI